MMGYRHNLDRPGGESCLDIEKNSYTRHKSLSAYSYAPRKSRDGEASAAWSTADKEEGQGRARPVLCSLCFMIV